MQRHNWIAYLLAMGIALLPVQYGWAVAAGDSGSQTHQCHQAKSAQHHMHDGEHHQSVTATGDKHCDNHHQCSDHQHCAKCKVDKQLKESQHQNEMATHNVVSIAASFFDYYPDLHLRPPQH